MHISFSGDTIQSRPYVYTYTYVKRMEDYSKVSTVVGFLEGGIRDDFLKFSFFIYVLLIFIYFMYITFIIIRKKTIDFVRVKQTKEQRLGDYLSPINISPKE